MSFVNIISAKTTISLRCMKTLHIFFKIILLIRIQLGAVDVHQNELSHCECHAKKSIKKIIIHLWLLNNFYSSFHIYCQLLREKGHQGSAKKSC